MSTHQKRIARQRAKLAKLEERLGYLMSQRATEEEKLAELLEAANAEERDYLRQPIEATQVQT